MNHAQLRTKKVEQNFESIAIQQLILNTPKSIEAPPPLLRRWGRRIIQTTSNLLNLLKRQELVREIGPHHKPERRHEWEKAQHLRPRF